MQRDESDVPIQWIGTVSSVKDIGFNRIEVHNNVINASFNRSGLRLAWTRQCPHALYDHNCKVNKADFAVTIPVEALSGNKVYSDSLVSLGDGYLNNGFFEWEITPGLMDRRPIEKSVDDNFTVLGLTDGMVVGDFITVYPGCPRTTEACDLKFNNLPNYGGVPHLPGESPFASTSSIW